MEVKTAACAGSYLARLCCIACFYFVVKPQFLPCCFNDLQCKPLNFSNLSFVPGFKFVQAWWETSSCSGRPEDWGVKVFLSVRFPGSWRVLSYGCGRLFLRFLTPFRLRQCLPWCLCLLSMSKYFGIFCICKYVSKAERCLRNFMQSSFHSLPLCCVSQSFLNLCGRADAGSGHEVGGSYMRPHIISIQNHFPNDGNQQHVAFIVVIQAARACISISLPPNSQRLHANYYYTIIDDRCLFLSPDSWYHQRVPLLHQA